MKRKEFLFIAIGIFLTIVAWVVIEIYKIQNTQLVEQEVEIPRVKRYDIDTSVIDKLREKQP